MLGVTQFNASSCLFLIIIALSFSLSVTNVATENVTQVVPMTTLIINSIVLFAILLQTFGVKTLAKLGDLNVVLFWIIVGLTFMQSLQNVFDSNQERRSLPIIVLVVTSPVVILGLYVLLTMLMKMIK